MFSPQQVKEFSGLRTPFYFYDMGLLKRTLEEVKHHSTKYGFEVHYALKANFNEEILKEIQKAGLGADCVSGNEVSKAVEKGFAPHKIVLAGVGKTDEEIETGLTHNIFCFNCESVQEMEVMNGIAQRMGKTAPIALRINPNVNANTHKFITTGLSENKFGIGLHELDQVVDKVKSLPHLRLTGIHFHIGSQITDLNSFKSLCLKVNELSKWFESKKIHLEHINVGGGLGIDYHHPDENNMADFANYFKLYKDFIQLEKGQQLHFELGRAIVGQCGTLISKVLYVKKGVQTNFLVLDAGMTELMRPVLYQAYHKIENLSRAHSKSTEFYDVVGPICESTDCFGKRIALPLSERGDIIAIRSAGAYGEVMASNYNLREKPASVYGE